uniref:Uncharacterized protein n=1 Tax=Rhizophora mucronata TaxID=61149 RepID=A0A2P2NXG7_RHIMU
MFQSFKRIISHLGRKPSIPFD